MDALWERLPAGLYVFNYHRVGDANATPFDPNVFSCDEVAFREHVRLLKSNFDVVSAETMIDQVLGGRPLTKRLAVITFDDGYHDNFAAAFPILRDEGASAIFFLPTALVASSVVPWWDEIAWLVKNTREPFISASWINSPLSRSSQSVPELISKVLTAFKANPAEPAVKIEELKRTLKCEMPVHAAEPLFLNWEQAKAMREGGMDIGSHAHTHQILAHLTREQQRQELTTSKTILESHLGERVHTVAYPVGTKGAFNDDTLELAKACGYKAGFSYIQGVNNSKRLQPFELRRISVDNNPDVWGVKLATLRATDMGLRAQQLVEQQRRIFGALRNRIRKPSTPINGSSDVADAP